MKSIVIISALCIISFICYSPIKKMINQLSNKNEEEFESNNNDNKLLSNKLKGLQGKANKDNIKWFSTPSGGTEGFVKMPPQQQNKWQLKCEGTKKIHVTSTEYPVIQGTREVNDAETNANCLTGIRHYCHNKNSCYVVPHGRWIAFFPDGLVFSKRKWIELADWDYKGALYVDYKCV